MLIAAQPLNQVIRPIDDTYSADTNWHVLATDGTGYASIAALKAAGRTPFPGLPGGSILSALNVRSLTDTTTLAAGSPFQIAYNPVDPTVTPTKGDVCDGSAQNLSVPGMVYILWIQKTVSTDIVRIAGWG